MRQTPAEPVPEPNDPGGHGGQLRGEIPYAGDADARFTYGFTQNLFIFEFRIARAAKPIPAGVAVRLVPAVLPAPFFLPAGRVAGGTGRMAGWINRNGRLVSDIAVPIQTLRVPRLRHDRIRADEPPDDWIIPPGVVEQQTAAAVLPLTGEVSGQALPS